MKRNKKGNNIMKDGLKTMKKEWRTMKKIKGGEGRKSRAEIIA